MRWLVTEARDSHCPSTYHVPVLSVFDSNLTHHFLPQGVYKCCSFFLQCFPSHFSPGRFPINPSALNLNTTFLESYSLTPLIKPKLDVPVKFSHSAMCFPLHLPDSAIIIMGLLVTDWPPSTRLKHSDNQLRLS